MDFSELWVEKWRPRKLDDIILSPDLRKFCDDLSNQTIDKRAIPHLMFYGKPGTGKTSLGHIFVKDVLQCEYIYINGSEQNSIDIVRTTILNFIQTKSFDGKMKVVFIDEMDGFSRSSGSGSSAQESLRNIMEEYSPYCRFIMTCNSVHKIIEPIWSRVQAFEFCPNDKDYMQRCLHILKSENIALDSTQVPNLKNMIKSCYPDMRKCINLLQKNSIDGSFTVLSNNDGKMYRGVSDIVLNMLIDQRDVYALRKYLIDNEKAFQMDYHQLMRNLFESVYESKVDLKIRKRVMLLVTEYMYRHVTVLDKELNFFALCVDIEETL